MSFGIISIITIVPVVLILFTFAIVFSVRSQQKGIESGQQAEGGKHMIKTVYTYLILFATLMMTIGGSVAAFMAVADLVSPPGYYMTFEEYKRGSVGIKEPIPSNSNQPPAQNEVKSEEQLQKDYQILANEEKNRARERALNSLIKSFGWIVIPFPVFLYYQRRLRQE
jgi:hypothetical protein